MAVYMRLQPTTTLIFAFSLCIWSVLHAQSFTQGSDLTHRRRGSHGENLLKNGEKIKLRQVLGAAESSAESSSFNDYQQQKGQENNKAVADDLTIQKNELRRKLNREFVSISVPAFLQQAAEPIAGIVDTAFLGRLGPEALGGAGIALSAQAAISKLYNAPLSKTSISLVASKVGSSRKGSSNAATGADEDADDELSIAVSSGLLLAFAVGMLQLTVFSILAPTILAGMGLSKSNDMWQSATSYMRVRAIGAPASTLWLISNGIFRGLGDTKTPFIFSLLFNGLNFVLDPILIFSLDLGASGAAAATVVSHYSLLVPLLYALNRKVRLNVWNQMPALTKSIRRYVKAGAYVLGRTGGRVLAFTYCARQSALLGPVAAAAYNLTFQIGFAITQICESITVVVQALTSREMADKSRPQQLKSFAVSHIARGSIITDALVTVLLSVALYLRRSSILAGLTTDPAVREAAAGAFEAVLLAQIAKGIAFPVNGLILGGLDWRFSMLSIWFADLVCIGMLRFSQVPITVGKIWMAWAAFMTTEAIIGIIRFRSRTGVWKKLRCEGAQ